MEESSSWSPESVDKRQVDAAEVVGGNTDFDNGEIDEWPEHSFFLYIQYEHCGDVLYLLASCLRKYHSES